MKENFLNLISSLQEQAKALVIQIQEQAFYNLIKDYYQNTSTFMQKIIKYSCIGLSLFVMIYIPYSLIQESHSDIEIFNEYKNLAQNLIQSKNKPPQSSHSHSLFSFAQIKSSIEKKLAVFRLSTQQNMNIKKMKNGVSLNIHWLNLKEFTTISAILEKVHPQLKMTGLKITPEKEKLYFNITFTFQYFSIKKKIDKS